METEAFSIVEGVVGFYQGISGRAVPIDETCQEEPNSCPARKQR